MTLDPNMHFIVSEQTAKKLLAPLLLAITKSFGYVDQESSEELLEIQSSIMARVEECRYVSGDKEGVDITELSTALLVDIGRACSSVFNEEPDDVERAWVYILTGYNLFYLAMRDYVSKVTSPSPQEEDLDFEEEIPEHRTLH